MMLMDNSNDSKKCLDDRTYCRCVVFGWGIDCMSRTNSYSTVVELLKGIRRVQNLSIQYCPIMPTLPIFPNMKHLELKGYWPSRLILRFLECCPELKTLCIDGIAGWFCKEMVPACMLTNLTTIKFSKCEGYKGDMVFLEYVLGNAKALKTLTVTWKNILCIGEELWSQLVLIIPRASSHSEIYFRS
ncbi:FBD-associated F-box protein At4g10400-like [Helianthus annuus]|uniref:FBD-associated F-box protein At4g10400-like n=1 Tax=Helianthus annuus TaxID=4232 RepID=UPI000B9044B0|nr:FBD-associated F-box protein At4g10400-like [Helianthus annuus]